MANPKDKLTLKQQRFAQYYAKSGNASQAARDAGYSLKTAPKIGSENLHKQEVVDYIASLIKPRERRILSKDDLLERLTKIIEQDPDSGNTQTKVSDVMRAIELYGKHLKMFTDVVEHKHSLKDMIEQSYNKQLIETNEPIEVKEIEYAESKESTEAGPQED
jgi:phage terminase small subunit